MLRISAANAGPQSTAGYASDSSALLSSSSIPGLEDIFEQAQPSAADKRLRGGLNDSGLSSTPLGEDMSWGDAADKASDLRDPFSEPRETGNCRNTYFAISILFYSLGTFPKSSYLTRNCFNLMQQGMTVHDSKPQAQAQVCCPNSIAL